MGGKQKESRLVFKFFHNCLLVRHGARERGVGGGERARGEQIPSLVSLLWYSLSSRSPTDGGQSMRGKESEGREAEARVRGQIPSIVSQLRYPTIFAGLLHSELLHD